MRGLVPDLDTPVPLGPTLPALYQEDDFSQRFVGAFDAALAPIFASLDCFDAYLDPFVAPDDFLAWLAGWVGIEIDETSSPERQREIIARAVDLYRMRGTAAGLTAHVSILTGGHVEILESGAAGWSIDPGGEMVGSPEASLVVRVEVADPSTVDPRRLDALVAAAKPAHVPHRVQVVKG